LNTKGIELSEEALATLLSINPDLVSTDLDDAEAFLAQFGDRLPQEILDELQATRERLSL
jgi:GTP-dependent phosphoenolpyruvate carboxykinase